jgi:hypothetical protein
MNPKDFKFFYKKDNNLEFEKISKMFYQYVEKATKENLEFCKTLDEIILSNVKMLNEKLKE